MKCVPADNGNVGWANYVELLDVLAGRQIDRPTLEVQIDRFVSVEKTDCEDRIDSAGLVLDTWRVE